MKKILDFYKRSFHGSPTKVSLLARNFSFLKRKKSMKKIPQDIIGNIAVLKFPKRTLWLIKKIKAKKFLKENKIVKTVVEKIEGFSGELRISKTKHLAGIKTKEATYKENQCVFKFNIDESYFSPRLSNERKIIADEVVKLCKNKNTKIGTAPTNNKNKSVRVETAPTNNKNKSVRVETAPTNNKNKPVRVLVMFAGISPYPIIIAKKLKQAKKQAIIISNELNKKANKESEKNIRLNKLQDYITLINGDVKKLPAKLKSLSSARKAGNTPLPTANCQLPTKFDIIIMPRPNLKDTFLKTALKLSKKGTIIFYHGFGAKEEVLEEIKKKTKNKIGKIKIQKAGDIGAYKYRWQAKFKIK